MIPLALSGLGIGEEEAVRRSLDWVAGMQSRDGGWGAFDVDNRAMWLYKIPFCDFGKVTDEPSADVSGHVLKALAPAGAYGASVERGLGWLLDEQEDDGSWFGRWGVNHLYGTGAALPALEACGVPHDHPSFRRRSPGSTPSSRRAAASARTSGPTRIPPGAAGRPSRRRRKQRGRSRPRGRRKR